MNRPEVPHRLKDYRYAPLRVILFEDEQSRGIFEYDRPSSFFGQYFGQYGDKHEVIRCLDTTPEATLFIAAG
jgi:hypothetical protein